MDSKKLVRNSAAVAVRASMVTALGAVLVSALAAGNAAAADDKLFSGASCNYLEDDNSAQSRYSGTFRNTSTAARWVICPFAIDQPSTSNMERIIIAADAVVDEDTCEATAAPEDGSGYSWWPHTDVIVAQGTVNYTRFWPSTATGQWADGPNWASWYIACQLPASSQIYNVYVEER